MDSEEQMPPVVRWRVECLGGPWRDGEPCVRFVDLLVSRYVDALLAAPLTMETLRAAGLAPDAQP